MSETVMKRHQITRIQALWPSANPNAEIIGAPDRPLILSQAGVRRTAAGAGTGSLKVWLESFVYGRQMLPIRSWEVIQHLKREIDGTPLRRMQRILLKCCKDSLRSAHGGEQARGRFTRKVQRRTEIQG